MAQKTEERIGGGGGEGNRKEKKGCVTQKTKKEGEISLSSESSVDFIFSMRVVYSAEICSILLEIEFVCV